ncbi:hypothetical protein ACFLVB_04315 [Chloroflexota bacterium]
MSLDRVRIIDTTPATERERRSGIIAGTWLAGKLRLEELPPTM